MVRFFNQRLSGGSDPKMTRGEIIKLYVRIHLWAPSLCVDATPVKNMWWIESGLKEIMAAAPAMGKHGMSKTRFERMRHLAGVSFGFGFGMSA